MKNLNEFEQKIKDKSRIIMLIDYNGIVASTEPKINSPLANTTFKRVLGNFAKKDYIKLVIITDRKINEFRKEFGLDLKDIDIYEIQEQKAQKEGEKTSVKKEKIIDKAMKENPEFLPIYIGDDKLLFSKVKKLKGYSVGIIPLCEEGEKLVDFAVSQKTFEEFLINVNNLFL